jgi:3-phenylpropionate/trans-cinnamate dioxygenase ferredoxin subunit
MPERLVKAAMKSDIKPGAMKAVEIEGLPIGICRVGDSFYAIGDMCTHDGAPLDGGEMVGDQIECPRHGARFDVKSGKAMCLPAVTPVPIYRLEEKGEELWIALPK